MDIVHFVRAQLGSRIANIIVLFDWDIVYQKGGDINIVSIWCRPK